MRFLFIPLLLLAVASCGDEPQTGVRKEYREKDRDPATLSNFTALYHMKAGTVGGKKLVPNAFNYDIKGLAELTYKSADRTAILRMAACVEAKCEPPGGAIAVTSPTLILTKLTDREIWFQTAPGSVTTVSLWGEGLQADGRPFALAATANGVIPYKWSGIQFPYE